MKLQIKDSKVKLHLIKTLINKIQNKMNNKSVFYNKVINKI